MLADELPGDAVVEIVADLFYRLGLNGVVINEPPATDAGKTPVSVTGYFLQDASADMNRSRLQHLVDDLSVRGISRCEVTYREIDEENWADSWKAHFHPQRIGRHLVVKPTFLDYQTRPDDIVIEIDPGMAFGTGTHATTRMCLLMLERHFKKGMTFLDVGTGSGILMIAAFKLGASTVRGVDNDPVAVEIAGANLALNRVDASRATVFSADLIDGVSGPFDMVCANIVAEVVAALIPGIKRLLSPEGRFVCSGIMASKIRLVEDPLRRFGFSIVERLADEEWVCLAVSPE
jgi:ribosomal protein L11 methyltransferase